MDKADIQPIQSKRNNSLYIIICSAVVLLAIIAFFTYQEFNKKQAPTPVKEQKETEIIPTPVVSPSSSIFKDGSYQATGNYVSPGGPREIDVTIVIKNGVVEDSTFVGKATDPTSKRFQGEFAQGYKSQVIGKPIAELSLTKVAGSSLTPKGFNDALEKIKEESQKA